MPTTPPHPLPPAVSVGSASSSLVGLDLAALETFIAVAELGSFSAAAERLHVSQPSVTGRVQRLETALGTRLLIRTTRKVEPTADGAALLAEAGAALDGLRRTVAGFRERSQRARRRVVVAATPMLAATTLPAIIRDYSQRYTDVLVVLRDLRYAEALAAVDEGSADLALLSFEGDDARFAVEAVAHDDVVLVVPAGHALAAATRVDVAAFAATPLVVVDQYEPMRARIAEVLSARGLEPAPWTTTSNLNTLLGLLDAGMAATLLTRAMAERRRRGSGLAIVEIDGIRLERTFSIVRSERTPLGTAAESFAGFARQAMR